MYLYQAAHPQPGLTLLLTISFTFGVIHVHSHPVSSSILRANGVVKKICLFVPSLNGQRFDSAVRTSFPLPSCLILTLTPVPTDRNRRRLLPRALQSHPRIFRRSEHPQHVLSHKSMGTHWRYRALGNIVEIGKTVTLKLAQVSSEVTEVWVRLDGWKI